MPTLPQINGMLLEEVLLYLLRCTGYQTIESTNSDPTLKNGHSGLEVIGRGGEHQIDAIADFLVSQPFSHPQRLLVEAKCLSPANKVGIEVVRNAVGVLKDVNEFWAIHGSSIPTKRHHYQYAIFSASGYTKDAEKYAFAQDVYLIPLAQSHFFANILDAIRQLKEEDFGVGKRHNIPLDMHDLRRMVRNSLHNGNMQFDFPSSYADAIDRLKEIIKRCRQIDFALIAVIGRQFPVFLTPAPDADGSHILDQSDSIPVQIYWDSQQWYLKTNNGEPLFSFELPRELFLLYAKEGMLTPRRALNLKEEMFSEFMAIKSDGKKLRVIRFMLDQDWIGYIRERLE